MSIEKSSYRSGELARLADVSTDTLRYYERRAVLARPLRGPNGYRHYPATALQRVGLIRRALSVGFTLNELAAVLKVRDHGGAPCAEVRQLAAAKLAEVETRLRETIELRDELRAVLTDWDSRMAHRVPGEQARLLDSLAAAGIGKTGNRRPVSPVYTSKGRKEKKSK